MSLLGNLFFIAISFVLSRRSKPEVEQRKPADLDDARFTTATEGRAIPLLWGRVQVVNPNVIWWGLVAVDPLGGLDVKTAQFGVTQEKGVFSYFATIQQALCSGSPSANSAEEVKLVRAWIETKIVFDGLTSPPILGHEDTFAVDENSINGNDAGFKGTMQFFAGTPTQTAKTSLTGFRVSSSKLPFPVTGTGYTLGDILNEDAVDGTAITTAQFIVTKTNPINGQPTGYSVFNNGLYSVIPTSSILPLSGGTGTGATVQVTFTTALIISGASSVAYRGLSYVIPFDNSPFVGNSPVLNDWKFEVQRQPNGLVLTNGRQAVANGGANPANVLFEILSDADWGLGIATARIDSANMTIAANTLATEGNGFSFLLNKVEDIRDLIRRVEDQIDGYLHIDPFTDKWSLLLFRDDFDIDTVPEINSSNLITPTVFTRETFETTTNQIRIPFKDAEDQYKDTYGFAQDMAGVFALNVNISESITFPGIKNKTLAHAVAWRELRSKARPLAIGIWVCNRSLAKVKPGDVVAFTAPEIGENRLPIRITSVDYGDLINGRVTIAGVEDDFFAVAGSFDDAPSSLFATPTIDLAEYPVTDRFVMEAPRAILQRDPGSAYPLVSKLFAGARNQTGELSFEIVQRNTPSTSGNFVANGEVTTFMLLGQLQSALLLSGSTPGTTDITLSSQPDSQSDLSTAFPAASSPSQIGTSLQGLCLVDDEFILVTSATTSGSDVILENVYRGVMDSVQADHLSGSLVHLIFIGSGVGDMILPVLGTTVEVKLLPKSSLATLPEGPVTAIMLTTSARTLRPYPPASFNLNTVTLDRTLVDIDGTQPGGGETVDTTGILVDVIIRRDFRVIDEVQALTVDADTIDPTFPLTNQTTVELECKDGATVLLTSALLGGASPSHVFVANDILVALDTTTLPASLTIIARERHAEQGAIYFSRVDLEDTFTIVSDLIGEHAWGALTAASEVSNTYTVISGDEGTDHDLTIPSSMATSDVQYRLDGGSFVTVIAAGNTSGSIPNASLSIGTTIAIKHTASDSAPNRRCVMKVGSNVRAYAILLIA